MQRLITTIRVFSGFALLFGLIYPLVILGVGNLVFPRNAQGGLIKRDGKIIGSKLIAQNFSSPKYFHSRFSAVNYNAMGSGGNNLAPSNKKLIELATNRIKQIRGVNNLADKIALPADMVLDSASGLDPHISLANALLQLPRVAKQRNLSAATIKKLIHANTQPDFVGIWGQAGVNVLRLNLALDRLNVSR
jgi:potassium-transporting ATPase KdpC subunit